MAAKSFASDHSPDARGAVALVGRFGAVLALLSTPPIFSRCFSMAPLESPEKRALWIFSLLLALVAAILAFRAKSIRIALVSLGIFLLLALELGVRAYVVALRPDSRAALNHRALLTYPENLAYRGHPFLQFTGNPSMPLESSGGRAALPVFNRWGFQGPAYPYEKPPNVVRVAALGGSTTEDGYPRVLEEWLNSHGRTESRTFEVLNFGLGWYTSAHCVVNFALNVVDFSPDYVIFHEAWNDEVARETGFEFRGDYSHALTYFHEPEIADRYPTRVSVVYRLITSMTRPAQPWMSLENATVQRGIRRWAKTWSDTSELSAFRRNVRTIVDLATARGIRPLLATQPHATDNSLKWPEYAQHIDQVNEVAREISRQSGERLVFVDLDRVMTGRNAVFVDVAHVNDEGRRIKAEEIGKALLADLSARDQAH